MGQCGYHGCCKRYYEEENRGDLPTYEGHKHEREEKCGINESFNHSFNVINNILIVVAGNEVDWTRLANGLGALEQTPVMNGTSGMLGPFTWEITPDVANGRFGVNLKALGHTIVNTVLTRENPKMAINMPVVGLDIEGEVGVDFEKKNIYLKVLFKYAGHSKKYECIMYSF